ncbi:hypothetical protein [Vibrio methylphosphonaticus]|uniref:hypothetical protein n=1 Tax=Vibrio methylphosphonaticus TaxID=2946866 RepID=UPI00202A4E4B|nr:hypothetical protein [Vibrio methylphosphonaticus]MCL9777371.1 hypothetical protein [Vibrio methylphosphonaticus]
MNKILLATLFTASLSGCSVYNMAKEVSQMINYDVTSNDVYFNSSDGSQYLVAPNRNKEKHQILVCYNNEGLFSYTAEEPLRAVANEWLEQNRDGAIATEGNKNSGVVEARVCYEYLYEAPQPIGAYLDEETGEVVIVGEKTLENDKPGEVTTFDDES